MPALPISVVLPVRNGEKFLREAVESLYRQTFRDFELLVVDDGSTDGTEAVLRSLGDPRLKVLKCQGAGLVDALNTGIRAAQGELIARMDGDDIAAPQRLELQVAHLKAHPEVIAMGGAVEEIDREGRMLNAKRMFPLSHDEIFRGLLRQRFVICHPALVFRKAAAIAIGLYDPHFGHAEDTDFLSRLVLAGRLANLPEIVLAYRITDSATTTTQNHLLRAAALVTSRILRRAVVTGLYQPRDEELAFLESLKLTRTFEADAALREAIYQYRIGAALLRGHRKREGLRRLYAAASSFPVRWIALSLRLVFGTVALPNPPETARNHQKRL